MRRSLFTKWRLLFALVVCSIAFVSYDYVTYHSRYNAAMDVVFRHDGHAGSLWSCWPLGRVCRISFTRPLTDEELSELAVLNSLSGRHRVAVAINCDLDDAQLRATRDALHKCAVFQPAQFREP